MWHVLPLTWILNLSWDLKMCFDFKSNLTSAIGKFSKLWHLASYFSHHNAMAYDNDLKVNVTGILNAYISALIKEKVCCALGPEFDPDAGKSAIIVCSLYGLKSAGAAFHAHLADWMWNLGYTSCPAKPDLWYKEVK